MIGTDVLVATPTKTCYASTMPRALLLLAFGCPALVMPARAEICVEARECFEWFGTLGFPDVKDAPWAEISPDYPVRARETTSTGFVIEDTKQRFRVMGLNLLPKWQSRFDPAKPKHIGWRFVERSFTAMAESYLDKLRDPPSDWKRLGERYGEPTIGRRGEVLALAHACWRKDEPDLAQQLFEEAKKIPTEGNTGREIAEIPMRKSLEMEFGHLAMWDAILRVGKLRWDEWHNGQEMVPRTELLKLFQEIVRKYPASPHLERAQQTAALLQRMVEEDAARPVLSEDAIAALPVDEQIREWIFRLRDQSGLQFSEPGWCSVFAMGPIDLGTSPAHRLAQIGYPAVPQLIEALSDDRFSRAVGCSRSFFFSHEILTIGDCAYQILYQITGQSLDPAGARAWWEQFQEKGEKQMLIDAISSGADASYSLVLKLKAKWPESLEPALLAGADKAERTKGEFIRALAKLNSPAATERLRKFMREDPLRANRIAAARVLLDLDQPGVVPAMLGEWTNFPTESSGKKRARVPDEFEGLIHVLIASRSSDALQALSQKWAELGPYERFSIVTSLGDSLVFAPEPKSLSPEPRDDAVALLIRALDDTTMVAGLSGQINAFAYSSPRICDMAAWALHRIQPETYSFSNKAGRRQRDLERITMINTWRKAHNLELLPVPASPSKLAPQEALRITHFADLSPEVTAGEELREKVIALVGTNLQGNTLPYLIQWIAIIADSGVRSVKVDARRDKDLRGVEVEMRLEAGEPATALTDWRIQLQATVGERTVSHNPRASLKDPREDGYWQEVVEEMNAALQVPPETELLIHAEIEAPVTF